MTTFKLDPEAGNDANDGSTFALRWRTLTAGATAARTAPGDTVEIIGSRTGTLSMSLTNGSASVTVPANNHKVLSQCDATTGWTSPAGGTVTNSTTRRYGTNSIQVACTSLTGKILMFDIGSDTDLSTWSAIWMSIQASALTAMGAAYNDFRVQLCSDTGGDTVVNEIPLFPSLPNGGAPYLTSGTWVVPFLFNGGALGSSIRTLVIYNAGSAWTGTIRVDNVGACHDPAVTANAMTPWTVAADDTIDNALTASVDAWMFNCSVMIDDTTLSIMKGPVDQTADVWRGQARSSHTCNLLHSLSKFGYSYPSTVAGNIDITQESGTAAAPIVYKGGYARDDMASQTGYTVVASFTNVGRLCPCPTSITYNGFERLIGCNCANDFLSETANSGSYFYLKEVGYIGTRYAVPQNSSGRYFEKVCACFGQSGLYLGFANMVGKNLKGMGTTSGSIGITGRTQGENIRTHGAATGLAVGGSPSWGMALPTINAVWDKSTTAAVTGSATTINRLTTTAPALFSGTNSGLRIYALNDDPLASVFWGWECYWKTQNSVADGGSGYALQGFVMTNTHREQYPCIIELPFIDSTAGVSQTISIKLRRSSTNISMKLVVGAGYTLNARQETAVLTPSTSAFDTTTLTFTPDRTGVSCPCIEAWSSDATSSFYADTFSVT